MQTILGSGGAIGTALARELYSYTDRVRLVSRNPQKVTENDELVSADLSDPKEIDRAVAGSEVVYITVGYEYSARVWETIWPAFMQRVIDSCSRYNCKLVFFDNIYLYDQEEVPHMTEDSKIDPSSRKGKVRARLHEMIMSAVSQGRLQALIARAADFYGPGIGNSVLQEMVMKNLKEGKAAYWFINADLKHSFTYTPDAAKATAMLGNAQDAYNQVWHLPVPSGALTGREWVELFASELNVKPKIRIMPKFLLAFMALFTPVLKEFKEMMYQWDREYMLDSSKFNERFNFTPVTYQEGVHKVVQAATD